MQAHAQQAGQPSSCGFLFLTFFVLVEVSSHFLSSTRVPLIHTTHFHSYHAQELTCKKNTTLNPVDLQRSLPPPASHQQGLPDHANLHHTRKQHTKMISTSKINNSNLCRPAVKYHVFFLAPTNRLNKNIHIC